MTEGQVSGNPGLIPVYAGSCTEELSVGLERRRHRQSRTGSRSWSQM